jgi:hypothetical protein
MSLREVQLRDRPFDPVAILEALCVAQIEFVVIGGVAAFLRGSPMATIDLDAAVPTDDANLEQFAAVLRDLGGVVAVGINVEAGTATVLDMALDAATLRSLCPPRILTRHGVIDIVWHAAAVGGYQEWRKGASVMDLEGFTLHVAGIDDLIRSKRAAGRPKDVVGVRYLEDIRRRQSD